MKLIVNAHPPGTKDYDSDYGIYHFGPFSSLEEVEKAKERLEDAGWTYIGNKPLNNIDSPLGLSQNWTGLMV